MVLVYVTSLIEIQTIIRNYAAHLAFENQCTDDYITEKLWGVFDAGVIPVYYGAPNIEEHVPANSVVNVRDLARHIDENRVERNAMVVLPRMALTAFARMVCAQVQFHTRALRVQALSVGSFTAPKNDVGSHPSKGGVAFIYTHNYKSHNRQCYAQRKTKQSRIISCGARVGNIIN